MELASPLSSLIVSHLAHMEFKSDIRNSKTELSEEVQNVVSNFKGMFGTLQECQ